MTALPLLSLFLMLYVNGCRPERTVDKCAAAAAAAHRSASQSGDERPVRKRSCCQQEVRRGIATCRRGFADIQRGRRARFCPTGVSSMPAWKRWWFQVSGRGLPSSLLLGRGRRRRLLLPFAGETEAPEPDEGRMTGIAAIARLAHAGGRPTTAGLFSAACCCCVFVAKSALYVR